MEKGESLVLLSRRGPDWTDCGDRSGFVREVRLDVLLSRLAVSDLVEDEEIRTDC